jgi:predicted molibdopterin-dependent oxidoreductase YjgC
VVCTTGVPGYSRCGQARTQARLSDRMPPGTIFLAFHWREAPANVLTYDFGLEPYAKIPEYKVSAVRLENSSRREA